MILGLVPAAGKSERMGQPKLALKLGGSAVLEHVIAALRGGGVDELLVVIAPHVAQLQPLAESAGAHVLLLPSATPDMRATVEAGLAWFEAHFAPCPADSWLLAPADHPAMDPILVRELIAASRQLPEGAIVVPAWQGKRGHPTMIGWSHVSGLRQFPKEHGLNAYLRRQGDMTWEIEAPSSGIMTDMDTPEDYERLRRETGLT